MLVAAKVNVAMEALESITPGAELLRELTALRAVATAARDLVAWPPKSPPNVSGLREALADLDALPGGGES